MTIAVDMGRKATNQTKTNKQKVLQNAPRGAFCNTFDLHSSTICHKDLCFVYFWVTLLHRFYCIRLTCIMWKPVFVVVVFVFNVPPTAKVIWGRGHSLKSHPKDWWSRESKLQSLVYKASGLSTTQDSNWERHKKNLLGYRDYIVPRILIEHVWLYTHCILIDYHMKLHLGVI